MWCRFACDQGVRRDSCPPVCEPLQAAAAHLVQDLGWHADARWAPQHTFLAGKTCCWVGGKVKTRAMLQVASNAVQRSRRVAQNAAGQAQWRDTCKQVWSAVILPSYRLPLVQVWKLTSQQTAWRTCLRWTGSLVCGEA